MAVIDIRNLEVGFDTPEGKVQAVNGINLSVDRGECIGIVGESGSGKSQTFMAAMGLLARNGTARGEILFQGEQILGLGSRALNRIRGNAMSMIFQDPMTALTPHLRIGDQLTEVLTTHKGLGKRAAAARAVAMLEQVRIPEPARRMRQYPHELSGGMRQRVMIAMALLCEPELLIADEPTTALDVTVQAQVLSLMRDLKDRLNTALVLITHDLGVVAGLADRVMVMYAGLVVEEGPVETIFTDPRHPYTQGLLNSMPRIDRAGEERLTAIPGQPPNLQRLPSGCAFRPRCAYAFERCEQERPELEDIAPGRRKACHRERLEAVS
ncbi:MAG: ABC transporter ATP-binding protein [Alphaproteobacteria bacterium]|nr:MAG: ABC transporter ATP-binding protein [Alphaproteobacteria bacterium]